VLVLLYERRGEAHVVLTRRAWHLRHHAGEVAFPGGRSEPGDADLWATALREAAEEISLDTGSARCVGRLDSFRTVTSSSRACPFVAVAEARPALRPDPAEVDSVLRVAVSDLLADDAWHEELWTLSGQPERAMTFFMLPGDTIWGATAAVLRQLLTVSTASASSGVPTGASARH